MSNSRARNRRFHFELLESRRVLASDFTLLADINSDLEESGIPVKKLAASSTHAYVFSNNGIQDQIYSHKDGAAELLLEPKGWVHDVAAIGDKGLFSAHSDDHGVTLWASDGTAPGTQILKDRDGRPVNSFPTGFTEVDNKLFFFAYGSMFKGTLWTTDGTSEGTYQVSTIESPSQTVPTFRSDRISFGGEFWFVYNDEVHGSEIWRSDGTEVGTHIAFETIVGAGSTDPRNFKSLSSKLLFETDNGLFAIDQAGVVTQFATQDFEFEKAATFRDKIYFTNQQNELWSSDGTEQGTQLVTSLPGSVANLTSSESKLFVAMDMTHPFTVFISDGTANGTKQWESLDGSRYFATNFYVNASGVHFLGKHGSDEGLFQSDINGDLVRLVHRQELSIGSRDLTSVTIDGKLYFQYPENPVGRLWTTDGTAENTRPITDGKIKTKSADILYPVSAGNYAYALATSPPKAIELWRTDATPDGTERIFDGSDLPRYISAFGDEVAIFTQDITGIDPLTSAPIVQSLWLGDGTSDGTVKVYEFTDDADSVRVQDAFQVGDKLFFWLTREKNQVTTTQLWASDGTSLGTKKVADSIDGWLTSFGETSAKRSAAGDLVYFRTTTIDNVITLWRTDGSTENTFPIRTMMATDNPVLIGSIPSVGTDFFFSTTVGTIYRSDGTVDGTVKVLEVEGEFLTATVYDGKLFCFTREALWAFDPASSASPTLVKTLQIVYAPQLAQLEGKLYFVNEFPHKLWVTDGTTDGTHVVDATIPSISQIFDLKAINNAIYFSAADNSHGRELWKSDGTTTTLVGDATGDSSSSDPYPFAAGSRVLATAFTKEYGRELYSIDTPDRSLTISGSIVPENLSANHEVGVLDLSNYAGLALEYTLVSDVHDNQYFKIEGDQLSTLTSFDFETKSTYEILVRVENPFETILEQYLTISISDVNEPPALEHSNFEFPENSPPGEIGQIVIIDPDFGSQYTIRLQSGSDLPPNNNDSAVIVGNSLRSVRTFDYEQEQQHVYLIEATDQTGQTFPFSIQVTIIDLNEAPKSLALSNRSIQENMPSGSLIGTVSAIDQDFNDKLSFALVSGIGSEDNPLFQIIGTQLHTAAVLDFEQQPTRTIRLQASDIQGLSVEQIFVIEIVNVAEKPIAVADDFSFSRHYPEDLNLAVNDIGLERDLELSSIVIKRAPQNVSVTLLPNGMIRAAAINQFAGMDSLEYTVADKSGLVSLPEIVTFKVLASSYQNAENPTDVDDNEIVTPTDALLIINELNTVGRYFLTKPVGVVSTFFDVDANGMVSPTDAVIVINELNSRPSEGERESSEQIDNGIRSSNMLVDLALRDYESFDETARKKRSRG